ncbi:hypothetical protein M758_5G003400 [Ceratodon purpureus]|nr:hypothetical protein M758_5G003400 [Ceratodon purpureus]
MVLDDEGSDLERSQIRGGVLQIANVYFLIIPCKWSLFLCKLKWIILGRMSVAVLSHCLPAERAHNAPF